MKKTKILVVDDACFMRNLLGNTIREIGYSEIHFADSGSQAIERARTMKPDLITLDLSMPGMDGLEAMQKILEVSSASKVIMVSAVTTQSTMKQAMQNGAVDFIRKPFDKIEVEGKLKKYAVK